MDRHAIMNGLVEGLLNLGYYAYIESQNIEVALVLNGFIVNPIFILSGTTLTLDSNYDEIQSRYFDINDPNLFQNIAAVLGEPE
jgi:hypothetical protein